MVNNPLPHRCRAVVKSLGSCSKEWETAGQRRAVRAWPWLQRNAKPIPTGPPFLHARVVRICPAELARGTCISLQVKPVSRKGLSARRAQTTWEASRLAQKRAREAAEVVMGTIAKSEQVRQRPAIVKENSRSKPQGALRL